MKTLVLVGGTGSLGRAILKQQDLLKENKISRIRILSRDEQKQALTEKEYKGDIELQCFLGDIRNLDRMEFGLKDAHYVIHAAALKMVERFELDVDEGYETNINGTRNVLKAFLKSKNAESGILVSTDKACNPINAYGVSKLAAQHVWLWGNTFQHDTELGVCLYGNVYGSRGSVIELWEKLRHQKMPLPITHAEMTRFFISKTDAARFVLKSLFNNKKKIMAPDMKSAEMTRIAELLTTMGLMEVGLRRGEKLHEEIVSSDFSIDSKTAPRFTDSELLGLHQGWLNGE